MNFLTRVESDDPILPFAPMVDIVFQLLIFFVTTSVFARLENELTVTVPTAESATAPKRTIGELIINVKQDGAIIVNQRRITPDQLGVLLGRIAKQYPEQSVIIRGDRNTALENAIHVLDLCARSGVWNVAFAAIPPEEKTPAAGKIRAKSSGT